MAVVITFPSKVEDPRPTESAITDAALHELLRKAVVAHRAGEARTPGSLGHRHHLAVSLAVLDAIQIVMGQEGLAQELDHCLSVGITDVRKLARIARDFDGPHSA